MPLAALPMTANISVCDLVRRDQEQNAQFLALKQAIQEGLESGVSNKTVGEIWEEAEQRSKNKRG